MKAVSTRNYSLSWFRVFDPRQPGVELHVVSYEGLSNATRVAAKNLPYSSEPGYDWLMQTIDSDRLSRRTLAISIAQRLM